MGISMQNSVAVVSSPPASPTANAAAPSGKSGTGLPAGGKNGDFAASLGKWMIGEAGGETMDELTLTLAALLGGLSPLQTLLNASVQTEQNGQNGLNGQIVGQISSLLSSHPEVLQSLLNDPKMQMWLSRAESLLAASIPGFQQLLNSRPAVGKVEPQAESALAAVSSGQAQTVVQELLAAAGREPDSVIYGQLMEDLKELIVPSHDKAASAADLAPGTQTGSSPLSASQGAVLSGRSIPERSKSEPVQPLLQAITWQTNVQGPAAKLVSRADQLQVLAAKSIYAAGIKPLTVSSGEPTVTVQDPVSDSSTNPLAALQLQPLPQPAGGDAAASFPLSTDARGFVQDMSQFVLKNFKVIGTGALSEAKLTLSPANLGHVDVKISMHDGQVVAHFVAQTASGKEMLESQLPQLKATLQNLGLQVGRLDVAQSGAFSSGLFQEHRQQQSSQQFGRQNKNGSYRDADSQSDEFSIDLAAQAALRSNAYGNRFNVMA